MLGDYSNLNDMILVLEEVEPEFEFALFKASGEEIQGRSYKRMTIDDGTFVKDFPPGYRLEWGPTTQGEIWPIGAMLVFPFPNAPEPIGYMQFNMVFVLYGSINGKRNFRIVNERDVRPVIPVIPAAN